MKLFIEQIKLEEKFRIRETLDLRRVGEYREIIEQLPPILAAKINGGIYLIDGFHRIEAAKQNGWLQIDVDMQEMDENSAYELAVKSNARHGVPLKTKERRRIAEELLRRFTERSNRSLADLAGVSKDTVNAIRTELESTGEISQLDYTTGKDGKARPASMPPKPALARPYTIYRHDARLLNELDIPPVHLVVTSPPYNVGIDYDEHDDNIPDYERFLTTVWKQCYEKLVIGGRIAVVAPFGTGRNPWKAITPIIVSTLEQSRFVIRGQIIWDKGTSGGRTTWGSYRLPTDPSLRDTCEMIMVAHKEVSHLEIPESVKKVDTEGSYSDFLANGDLFQQLAQDHWVIAPQNHYNVKHPAPFPTKLVENLIRFYAYPGAHILDPFAGSGSTGIAAIRLGCTATLLDISEAYVKMMEERCDREISK